MECVYCGFSGLMTREHLIPKFIYDVQNSFNSSYSGWNEAAEKIIKGEAKIKDVCAECNNVALGSLDSYAKNFLLNSGLLDRNYTKNHLFIRYDYSILLRWLLKISYNSSRLDGFHSFVHKEFLNFIINSKADLPSKEKIKLVVSMNKGVNLKEQAELRPSYIIGDVYNPFLFRVSYGANYSNHLVRHRIIIIGPAVFNVFIFSSGVFPGYSASFTRSFAKRMNGVVLDPKLRIARINESDHDWVDHLRIQSLKEQKIQTEYFQRLKFNKELFN